MKRFSLLLMVCLIGAICSADVLLNDTWADASRAETSLPTESAVWVSHSGSVTMGTGSLAYTQSTGSQKMWTYFAPDGSPVSLDVGEQLVTTIGFIPRVNLYDTSSKTFRFGLFNDPTNGQVLQNINSDAGGSTSPWADSTGYCVQLPLSLGTTASSNATLGKRIAGLSTSLLGSGSAYPGMTSGGSPIIAALDTLYTLTLELDRIAADQMQITFAIANAAGVISTHSILDDGTFGGYAVPVYTNFDQLFFRFSSAPEQPMLSISRVLGSNTLCLNRRRCCCWDWAVLF